MSVRRDLTDLTSLVDGLDPELAGGRPPMRDDVSRAIVLLMVHQCIYPTTPNIGKAYDTVKSYPWFFERYFSAMGYDLEIRPSDNMIALSVPIGIPRLESTYIRLDKKESLCILVLKLIRTDAINSADLAADGSFTLSTGLFFDRFNDTVGSSIDEPRLFEVLAVLQQHGCVRIIDREKDKTSYQIAILPGIDVISPTSFLDSLKTWIKNDQDSAD